MNFIEQIEIVNLLDDKKYLEEVSEWIWKEWSEEKGAKKEDILYRSKHSLGYDKIPQMYIAKYNEEVIGVVSIWRNDIMSRQDLYPWMSTLIVKPEYRNKGVGKKLQEKCIEECKRLKYENIYLITHHDNYYEKTGWEFLDNAPEIDGKYTKIYVHKL